MMEGLIDSHCHLDFPDFHEDFAGVLSRARGAGVARMITISTRVAHVAKIRTIAEAHSDIAYTVGTHPNHAYEEPDVALETLLSEAHHPKCVAIGEAGLDYHYDKTPRDIAKRVFATHIEAARQSGLPLVIHSRDCDADMAAMLRAEMAKGAFKAVLHCFTASEMLAQTGLELGLYISFSGVLTFKSAHALRAIAKSVPSERMLVETDSPYLAPTPFRGGRNEPAYVVETAKVLAEVRGMSLSALAQATTQNCQRLFEKLKNTADI